MKKSFLLLFLIVGILLYEAFNPAWLPHLASDVNNYYTKADYFLKHGDLTNFGSNEYQPGAIFYFVLFSPVLFLDNSAETYRLAFILGNVGLILAIGWFYFRKGKQIGQLVFSCLVLSIGPLILYRFELLVVSLFILAIHLWGKGRWMLACFVLGVATSVKVYPIVLLPYLLLITYKKGSFRGAFKNLISYFTGLVLPVISYMFLFKVDFDSILAGLAFHAHKPIDTEGIWSLLHTTYYLFKDGSFPLAVGGWGINGVSPIFTIGPHWIYNSLWVIALSAIYLFVFCNKKLWSELNIKVVILILLAFLSFSKVMAPQYITWVILLFPLLQVKQIHQRFWVINFGLAFSIMVLYQYIYPLNFNEWLGAYYNRGYTDLYWVNLLRNGLLFLLLYRVARSVCDE